MALKIDRNPQAAGAGIVADRRLFITKASDTLADREQGQRIVEEGDPEGAFLYAVGGDTIPASECARLGLSVVDGRVVQAAAEPEPTAEVEAADAGEGDASDEPADAPRSSRTRRGGR